MKKTIFVCIIGFILGAVLVYYYLRSEYVFLSKGQMELFENGVGLEMPIPPERIYTRREICEKLAYDEGISLVVPEIGILEVMRYEDVTPCWPFTIEEVIRRKEYQSYLDKEKELRKRMIKEKKDTVQLEAEFKELSMQLQDEIRALRENDFDAYVIFADLNMIDNSAEEDAKLHNQLMLHPAAKKLYEVFDRIAVVEQIFNETSTDKYLSEQILFRQNFISLIMRDMMAE